MKINKSGSQFPEEQCLVKDLHTKASALKASNHKAAEKLLKQIDKRTDKDPQIKKLTAKDAKKPAFAKLASNSNPPFDFNRTGRDLPGVFLNASDVHMAKQHYILAGLVRTVKCAENYFNAALRQNTTLFVSVQERGEAKGRCNGFWENKVLLQLNLNDGWKIKNVGSKVIANGKNGAHIKESILEVFKGDQKRQVTHLHFEGWHDKTQIPDEELFNKLLDRMEEISPHPHAPIAINCKAGKGRTGTVAVSHYLRKQVTAELAGNTMDKIRVNIPDVILNFRRQRSNAVGQPSQFAQIHSCLAAHCAKKK